MTLGDRVAVMRSGVLQQVGTPAELYDEPGEPLRRRLHRLAGDELHAGDSSRATTVKLPFGDVPAARRAASARSATAAARDVIAGIRPENFEDARWSATPRDRGHTFTAKIDLVESMGSELYAYFGVEGEGVRVARSSRSWPPTPAPPRCPARPRAPGGRAARRRRARSSAARRPSSGSTRRKLHLFDPERGRTCSGRTSRSARQARSLRRRWTKVSSSRAARPPQLLAQALDDLVVPVVGAQQQVAQADDAHVGLGLGAAAASGPASRSISTTGTYSSSKPGRGDLARGS